MTRLTIILCLLLSLGLMGSIFASVPQELPVAVIANVQCPVSELSFRQIRGMLLGDIREWPNHRRVTVVQQDPSGPVAPAVLNFFLRMSAGDYNRHLLRMEFVGSEPPAMKILASDESACNFVFNAPGAIGFVSSGMFDRPSCSSKVKKLRILEKVDTR